MGARRCVIKDYSCGGVTPHTPEGLANILYDTFGTALLHLFTFQMPDLY